MANSGPSPRRAPIHWPTVRHLFATELRLFLRDRRTLFWSVLLPLLVTPIFLVGMSFSERQREKRIEALTFHYVILGSEAERARELIRLGADAAPAEEEGVPEFIRQKTPKIQLEEKKLEGDPRALLDKREIHFVIETFSAAEVAEKKIEIAPPAKKADQTARPGQAVKETPAAPPPLLPLVRLLFAESWDYSRTAAGAMEARLDAALELGRVKALADAGFAVDREEVLPIAEERDLASAGQRTGFMLGRFALVWVLFFLLTGGSVIAADTIAGEKERGSLETLLTSAASRNDIVSAKMLLILAAGIAVAFLQVATFALYAGLRIMPLPESFAVELSPAAVLWLVLLMAPLAAIVAGVLLLVSAYSSTYKAFQQNFMPVLLISVWPALVAALPGIELRSAIVLVPISNLSVAVREVLVGKIDWLMLPLAFLISSAAAVLLLRAAANALSAERLITAADSDEADFAGGPALFERHALRYFAVMWVVLFLVTNNVQWLSESIERQLAFNFGVVFLGGSLVAIKRYQLDWREAFALRPVKPITWLAVLIGAPSFLLTGLAVAKLSEKFMPVPKEMLEAFGKALIPEDLGTMQMLLLLAILPGIAEELTFRGVLLYGLRRRFHPVVLALVVGLVFGLFHFALFRLASTAFLGAGLTAVTMLTGSVFPAMLWHALNNSLALLAGMNGLDLTALDTWIYPTAVLVAALAFFILWRNRTPLPGLRGAQSKDPSSSR
jgi:sodium transport system permease protein